MTIKDRACVRKRLLMKIIAFLLPVFLSSLCFAEPLEVGVTHAPPFYVVDGQDVKGLLADMLSEVLAKANIEFVMKPYPIKRLHLNLIKGTTDIYLGAPKPALSGFEDATIQSETSPVKLELWSLSTSREPLLNNIEDLSGKGVIVINGYAYGGLINHIKNPDQNISVYEVDSFAQGVGMLRKGRADYLLDYRKIAELYFKNDNASDLKYSVLSDVDLYFIVSKRTKGAEDVLTRIEKALNELNEG